MKLASALKDRMLWRSLRMALLVMLPLGILGNLTSEFVKQGDWMHVGFCLVAVICQLGLYFTIWPLGSVSWRRRQRQ